VRKLSQKALIAGFLATFIAIIFGKMTEGLGVWLSFEATAKTVLGGWLVLLVIGSSLGYLYSFVKFSQLFGKEAVVKGAAYGVVVWIATLILASIFPVLASTAFAEPIRTTLFLQLLTHVVWGVSLALLYERV
jgi:uncharacterized membrane protein YagU involved in acid resistance